jgi:hypothetical protein
MATGPVFNALVISLREVTGQSFGGTPKLSPAGRRSELAEMLKQKPSAQRVTGHSSLATGHSFGVRSLEFGGAEMLKQKPHGSFFRRFKTKGSFVSSMSPASFVSSA